MIHKLATVIAKDEISVYHLYFNDAKDFEPFHIIQQTNGYDTLLGRYIDLIFAVQILRERALTY